MRVLHVCLNVADVDRAVEWYTKNLGFEETWGFETADGAVNRYVTDENGVELQLSGTDGELALAREDPTAADESGETAGRWDHLAVSVEDVDAAFDGIDHHGVVDGPADRPAAGVRSAFVRDPDGRVVELVEPLDS